MDSFSLIFQPQAVYLYLVDKNFQDKSLTAYRSVTTKNGYAQALVEVLLAVGSYEEVCTVRTMTLITSQLNKKRHDQGRRRLPRKSR